MDHTSLYKEQVKLRIKNFLSQNFVTNKMFKLVAVIFILHLSFHTSKECPPLYETDPKNGTLCKLCPFGKVKITYDNSPCIYYNKETTGFAWSEIHEAIYKITYGFRDLLPDELLYDNETKWTKEACVIKNIKKGEKEKRRITSKILNLIYRFIRERDIYNKI